MCLFLCIFTITISDLTLTAYMLGPRCSVGLAPCLAACLHSFHINGTVKMGEPTGQMQTLQGGQIGSNAVLSDVSACTGVCPDLLPTQAPLTVCVTLQLFVVRKTISRYVIYKQLFICSSYLIVLSWTDSLSK